MLFYLCNSQKGPELTLTDQTISSDCHNDCSWSKMLPPLSQTDTFHKLLWNPHQPPESSLAAPSTSKFSACPLSYLPSTDSENLTLFHHAKTERELGWQS
ncbi:hypothetical protein CRENBAI_018352 [Crenichthys baileyi]|uniref:Prolactin receptor n=1 Tax=Crenichthys baileyi TaxID=28760 RepID=A0AAV9RJ07_9TELE